MLLILCLAALAGLLVGELARLDALALGVSAGVSVLAAVFLRHHPKGRAVALVACAAALGGLRSELHTPLDPDPLAHFAGLAVTLRGTVDTVPQRTERAVRFTLAVDRVSGVSIEQSSARVLVIADPTAPIQPAAPGPGQRPIPADPDNDVPTNIQARPAVAPESGAPTVEPPAVGIPDSGQAEAQSPPERVTTQPDRASAQTTPNAQPDPTISAPDHEPARANDLNAPNTDAVPPEILTEDPTLREMDLAPGDTVEVHGTLGPPDTGASTSTVQRTLVWPSIRLVQRDTSSPRALAARIRALAIAQIERRLPEPQASLAAGVLLGGSGNLDANFKLQLERSGLAHIVAIDGYKQILVTAALGALALRFIGRPWAAVPVLLGLLGYTLLTGARPSAVRAGIMVGLASLAYVVGYLPDALTSLLLAATLMAGWDPDILFDTGFQLSCSATLGLVLLWPRIRRALRGIPRPIAEPAGLTFAVTLATLPVTLTEFGSVSLVSPLAHVVGMPLLAPVLLGAALIAASAPLPLVAQQTVASLVNLPATLLVETVRWFGSLPSAALATGRLPVGPSIALGAALVVWGLWHIPEVADLRHRLCSWSPTDVFPPPHHPPPRQSQPRPAPSHPALASVVHSGQAKPKVAQQLAWQAAPMRGSSWRVLRRPMVVALGCGLGLLTCLFVRPDGRVHVQVLDVAPGQAVVIRGPTGRTALIGRGRLNARALTNAVAERLAVWEHGLDAAIDLDADAAERFEPTLQRYPAQARLHADQDARLDLGGGAVVDVYTRSPAEPAVALSFKSAWVRVLGQPPRPRSSPDASEPTDGNTPATTLDADHDLVLDASGAPDRENLGSQQRTPPTASDED